MARKSKRKVSPSTLEYYRNNPTISGRLPKKDRDQLLADLKIAGLTMTNAFQLLAGVIHTKAISLEQAERKGFEEAKKLYGVPYPCYGCKKPVLITSPETKKVVAEFLTKHGWGHKKCIEGTEST